MLNRLPTIIAQTYTLSKRDPRMTKDYQYFTVEYSLGVLCAVGYAVLEEHSDISPPKHNQDYSKMSMGLWLSLLRSLCSEMQNCRVRFRWCKYSKRLSLWVSQIDSAVCHQAQS